MRTWALAAAGKSSTADMAVTRILDSDFTVNTSLRLRRQTLDRCPRFPRMVR